MSALADAVRMERVRIRTVRSTFVLLALGLAALAVDRRAINLPPT